MSNGQGHGVVNVISMATNLCKYLKEGLSFTENYRAALQFADRQAAYDFIKKMKLPAEDFVVITFDAKEE